MQNLPQNEHLKNLHGCKQETPAVLNIPACMALLFLMMLIIILCLSNARGA